MLNVLSKHGWTLNCRCDLTDVSRAKIFYRDKIGLHSGFTLQPFMSRARQNFGAGLERYNSPVDWARKLFKPSTDSANLLVEIEKKIYVLGLGFFGGDVTGGGVFTFFGLIYEALDANPMSEFFRSSFFRNWTIIRVFRTLDWLSSKSGAKIMPQKPKSGQIFYSYERKPGVNNTQFVYGHNSPPEEPRELIKPSKDSWRLVH